MTDREFRLGRHYELWKEQNKQLSRWALGVLIFAAIVLIKVLAPQVDYTEQTIQLQKQRSEVENKLAAIEAQRQRLAKVGDRLEAVRSIIEDQPWMEEKDRLIMALRRLNNAYETLSSMQPDEIKRQIDAAAERSQRSMLQQAQSAPEANPVAEAVKALEITDRLTVGGDVGFRAFLRDQLMRRVQQEADNKARRIVQLVNERVVQPLEQLFADKDLKAMLPAVPEALERIRADMHTWEQEHVGNRSWYETIQMKDRELRMLTDFLKDKQEELSKPVRDLQEDLKRREKDLASRQDQVQEKAAKIESDLGELDNKMQQLLPDWLRGLGKPAEMIQLYPLVLLGLVCFLANKAVQIRRHYLVVREGYRLESLSLRDPAMSTMWTLAYRGALATTSTAMVYLGGLILLWVLFEQGASLAAEWLKLESVSPWIWSDPLLPVVTWLGRLLFALAAIGVVAALIKDRASISHSESSRSRPAMRKPADGNSGS
jgi:gas vesicle protein